MTIEEYLAGKLSRFSVLDYMLVILVYLSVGLLIASVFPSLQHIEWWLSFILMIVCLFPLITHLYSQPGKTLSDKLGSCLKHNTPALQTLLFMVMFFLALVISAWIPALTSMQWWVYLIAIVLLAIKPMQTSWIW